MVLNFANFLGNCFRIKAGTERFTIGNFTIPIVKRSFLKRIFIFFLGEKKEHFTIGKKKKATMGIVR